MAPSDLPEAAQIDFPLPEGTWVKTSQFGSRVDPITGQASFHTGTALRRPGRSNRLHAEFWQRTGQLHPGINLGAQQRTLPHDQRGRVGTSTRWWS